MSGDAEKFVETLGVTGGPGELLRRIAKRIPEGQTTTPAIATEDLAAVIGCHEQTVRRRRDALERKGVIKVHGGQGLVARYELVGFDGVRPATDVALPLVGAAPRRARVRPTVTEDTTRDLFEDAPSAYDQTAINIVHFARSTWAVVLRAFCTRYDQTAINIVHFARSTGIVLRAFCTMFVPRTNKQRSTSCILHEVPASAALPLGVPIPVAVDATTTYVRSKKDPERTYKNLEGVADARAREPAEVFLEWFEQTYPTVHDGAACTVPRPRDGPLVHELLNRPRHDVAHLQAMTRLLWAVTSDGVQKSDRWWIAERVTVRNIVVLHRKADFLDREVRLAERTAAAARNVWADVLAGIEKRLNRNSFYSWWKDSVLVEDRGEVLVVQLIADPERHELFKDWIQRHYAGVLAESLAAVRPGARVEFVAAERQRRNTG